MATSIGALIEIYQADELSKETRIRIIKKLGSAINYEFASNVTEPIVYELVLLLDPDDSIKDDPHYKEYSGEKG